MTPYDDDHHYYYSLQIDKSFKFEHNKQELNIIQILSISNELLFFSFIIHTLVKGHVSHIYCWLRIYIKKNQSLTVEILNLI